MRGTTKLRNENETKRNETKRNIYNYECITFLNDKISY